MTRADYSSTKQNSRELRRRKMPDEHDPEPNPRKFIRLSGEHEHHSTEMCFFCGKSLGMYCVMHQLLKLIFMETVCPQNAGQAPSSQTDLIAQEAKYHPQCLASLYNKAWDTKEAESSVDDINNGIAFAGLISYIEEVRTDSFVAPVFKLMGLVNLYRTRLEHQTEEQNT
jgi:hypothetical protein